MKTISFVIPCYRSQETIPLVIAEIVETMEFMSEYDYEILAVNDDSPDKTFDVLKDAARENNRIKVVSFLKNFGQHAGMMAGIRFSQGDYVVFLDDDGQCPLDHLSELLSPLVEGADVSIAQYGIKRQSLFKNFCSFCNEHAANILTEKPPKIQMGNFIAINRLVVDELKRYDGPYPYISGLLFRTSRRVVNVPMPERARMHGTSTYTIGKLFALWMNSFTAFSVKPLRLSAVLGIFTAFMGFLLGINVILNKLLFGTSVTGWTSLIASMLFLGGIILVVLGVIGEYIGRIYMTLNQTPQYVIRQTINVREDIQSCAVGSEGMLQKDEE